MGQVEAHRARPVSKRGLPVSTATPGAGTMCEVDGLRRRAKCLTEELPESGVCRDGPPAQLVGRELLCATAFVCGQRIAFLGLSRVQRVAPHDELAPGAGTPARFRAYGRSSPVRRLERLAQRTARAPGSDD